MKKKKNQVKFSGPFMAQETYTDKKDVHSFLKATVEERINKT